MYLTNTIIDLAPSKTFTMLLSLPRIILLGHIATTLYGLKLIPKDPLVCVTEDLKLTCAIESEDNITDVRLYERGEVVDGIADSVVIDGSKVYTFKNITFDRQYSNFLCKSQTSQTEASFLQVLDKPIPVENVRCWVYGLYNGTMVCSWSLGKTYNWNVSPVFKWRGASGEWSACPELSNTACTWSQQDMSVYSSIEISISVFTNVCPPPAVTLHTVHDIQTILKLNPVQSLKATPLNSSCVGVTWYPASLDNHSLEMRIIYTSKWSNENVLLNISTDNNNSATSINICDLRPYTNYIFNVTQKQLRGRYWSDDAVVTLTTPEEIPSKGPEITNGSFTWQPICKEALLMPINLYWKPLDEQYRNGELLEYRIIFSEIETSNEHVYSTAGTTHQLSIGILCNTSYEVCVQASNSKGLSPCGSILIKKPATAPQVPQSIIEYTEDTDGKSGIIVTLTSRQTGNFTLFWCTANHMGCANDGIFAWIQLAEEETFLEMKNASSYQFGVGVENEMGSSGTAWQSCIYTHNAEPTQKLENIFITTGKKDNTLFVEWNAIHCTPGDPFIIGYMVLYFEGKGFFPCSTCSEAKEQKIFGTTGVELGGLSEGKTYSVRVREISKGGKLGPLSDPVQGIPENNSIKDWEIVLVVTFSLIGIVLLLGLFFILRRCHKRLKEMLKYPTIKTLLDGSLGKSDGFQQNKTSGRGSSQDSGIGDIPLGVTEDDIVSGNQNYCLVSTGDHDVVIKGVNCYTLHDVAGELQI